MKNKLLVVMAVFGLLFMPLVARAEDSEETKTLFGDFLKEKNIEIAVAGTADFYNKYIWRGFLLDDDAVFEPGFSISSKGFTVSAWGNFDLENKDAFGSDEVDTTVSYTFSPIENLNLTVGHIYYSFMQASTFAKEVYASIGVSTFLSPVFTYYNDYSKQSQGGGNGQYYAFDISHSIPLIPEYKIALNLGAHAGYNSRDFIVGHGGDLLGTAGIAVPLTPNLTFTPKVAHAVPLGDVGDATDGNQREHIYGGVSMAYAF
jgi:hypothetical protein